MAQTIRKLLVIAVVAVLFAIFVFSLADAIAERVFKQDYPAICEEATQSKDYYGYEYPRTPTEECPKLDPPSQKLIDACPGTLNPDWSQGCPTSYTCYCNELTEQFSKQKDSIKFWLAVILGFIAIAVGMMLPSKEELNEWIGGGFILGGLISIFIATATYWRNIDTIIRPIVIALELALVVWLAYKKFRSTPINNDKKSKRKK